MLTIRHDIAIVGIALLLWSLFPGSAAYALGDNYVAPPFRALYRHDGMRLLGPSITGLLQADYPVQYFEKGRLEDHRGEGGDPVWATILGRLTCELIANAPHLQVNGTNT